MAARYGDTVYVGMVEGEDPDDERDNFTLIKHMEKKGPNEYVSENWTSCIQPTMISFAVWTLLFPSTIAPYPLTRIKNIAQKMVYFHFYFSIPHIALCTKLFIFKSVASLLPVLLHPSLNINLYEQCFTLFLWKDRRL